MTPIRRSWSSVVLVALVAVLAACTATDPDSRTRAHPRRRPRPRHRRHADGAASTGGDGSAHVVLNVATPNAVTIDVTDASSSLVGAASGTPGDGASVEAYTLAVANVTPTTLRLTWVGGPCDSANKLLIDAARHRLVVVQPECPGDAIATDRVLDLEFATPIKASDLETFLQDGLDT